MKTSALPRRLPLALAVAACCVGAAPAATRDLTALSLEQLTQIEVYGVSKAQERLLDAPASVSVITADQIRAFGYRTLADIIGSARGFFSHDDRAYTWIGVRGFAPVGDYNTRILVLIDGNRANDNVFEAAAVGTEGVIDVELIDRVEVIRGPSSSVYGTSAFFGVINIVTKDAAANSVAGRVGSGRERGGAATVAGGFNGGRYLLRASRTVSAGQDVELLPDGGRFSGVDGMTLTRVFAKVQQGGWRLDLGTMQRHKDAGYGLYGTDPGDRRAYTVDAYTFADLRHAGRLRADLDWSARVFYGDTPYRDRYVFSGDVTRDWFPGRWAGTEWQVTHRLSAAHRFVAGFEASRDIQSGIRTLSDASGELVNVRRSGSRTGVFVQDDFKWSDAFSSSLGARHDHVKGLSETSPRLALIWRTTPASALKLLAGSAFRAPSTYEGNYAIPGYYLANPDLKSEKIRTLDLDFETALGESGRFALTAYRYRATNLINLVDATGGGELQYRNVGVATARGVDLELEQAVLPVLRLRGVLSYSHAEDGEGRHLLNSPRRVARASALWQMTPTGWRAGVEARYVDRREVESGRIAAYTVANLTLTSPEARGAPDLSFSVRNLFDRRYGDPIEAPGLPSMPQAVSQPGRTWTVRVAYSF